MQTYFKLFLLFMGGLLSSCSQENRKPDVSHIDLTIKIERFDQDFSQIDTQHVLRDNKEWLATYGEFYLDYMLHILRVGSPADTLYMQHMLKAIVKQEDFKALTKAVDEKFPDLIIQEKELGQDFKYLQYYFPDYQVPRMISFFSGFAAQVPVGQGYIGIGLDMFLGADSPFYASLDQADSKLITRQFSPEYIVPSVVESALREEIFPQPLHAGNTLQRMIYDGKILYAMDCVLSVSDNLKIGYTAEQMKWSENNQKDIWSWIMHEDLLYSSDTLKTQKYFSTFPFSPELDKQNGSAPKLGSYIGWQIVRAFMKKNPTITLQGLFEQNDVQLILENSQYKAEG